MKLLWALIAMVVVLALRDLLTDPTRPPEAAKAETKPAVHPIRAHIQPRLDVNEVKAKLHRVRTALYQYNVSSGEVPVGLQEIVDAGYLQMNEVTDPWGREFAFRSEKKSSNSFMEEYEIFVYSTGPDGIRDNRDDIYL